MKISRIRFRATGLVASIALVGCAGAKATTTASPVTQGGSPTTATAAPIGNAGDVNFMKGMIPHHAQAVLIAGWAPSHGARDDLQRLCERIVVAQRDEITMMQNWLRSMGQEVPAADAKGMKMNMGGMTHEMLMPGMLTDDQLKELDAARGSQFDRLFLQAMIKHHLGAISMVEDLEKIDGAAPGRDRVPLLPGRVRRSDHRDRAHGEDARDDQVSAIARIYCSRVQLRSCSAADADVGP